jgi:two-component system, OmpR family, sensor histidine kinase SenX3
MGRFAGSRPLLAIGGALLILLAALAAVQYRWSTRVAAADAQREKEHLDSAAALFANEFNATIEQASAFAQNNARAALESGERLAALPKVIGELYYLETPAQGAPRAQRLGAGGRFSPSPVPEWVPASRCASFVISQPPALVVPVYDVVTTESQGAEGARIRKAFRWQQNRCFVARIDQSYLRGTLFPKLIRESFGATAAGEYDFAVVPAGRPGDPLYGTPIRADLQKRFFSITGPIAIGGPLPSGDRVFHQGVLIQQVETRATGGQVRMADLFSPGIWELDVAHKGRPLAAAFEHTRRLDLLLSLGVELLLVAAIVLLVIGARRVERLADQKMQFVAGVSHELRTPVSAISMLSRNQADGLVAGAEKVKQYGELIHQQSRRLNEMVEQALQYAGIHSGLRRPAKNELDLGQLIEETVEARRSELARGGFEVEIALNPDLPPVSGDARLLGMALDNLLNNAQKHAAAGHWIRVSAGYSAAEKEVRISVEDRGGGIDPADQAEIFEPFCRGRAAVAAQIPGSGLGLSLVRSAAEVHRGSVTLVSEPGGGSTFTMHLPV